LLLFKTITYPTGYLPISCLLILLKLSFSSSVYHNSLNSIILPFIPLTMSYSHPVDSVRNLVYLLIKNLSISKTCFHNIRNIRRIRNTIDQTILPAPLLLLIHYKIAIVTLFYSGVPATQTNRRQLVLNFAARAVITPILKFLHWLKINERIKYKVLSHI